MELTVVAVLQQQVGAAVTQASTRSDPVRHHPLLRRGRSLAGSPSAPSALLSSSAAALSPLHSTAAAVPFHIHEPNTH